MLTAASVTAGIVQEASEACDLVIGASLESSVDKVLFGDIPAAVVRESKAGHHLSPVKESPGRAAQPD
ncbi:MAG: hypothetical protein R3E31_23740 [Chloroflexota bacterium]